VALIVDGGAFDPDAWQEDMIIVCADKDRAAMAMERATPRILRVLWDGTEITDDALYDGEPPQLCEYVSEPYMAERGPRYAFDTQSEMSEEAGRACFEIIREELEAAGIQDATIERSDPFDHYSVGEGIFLPEADAIELSPLPDPITLLGVLEQWMPEGSVMRFSGMARFAAEHGSSDATVPRGCKYMTGAIGLDARTVRMFRRFAEDPEAHAQRVESVRVDGSNSLNILQLDQAIAMGRDRPPEAWAGFWQEVQMLLHFSGGLDGPAVEVRREAARPVLAYMEDLSAGRAPFDEAALKKLRDGVCRVIEAEVLAERRAHAIADQRPAGLVVHGDGVVLVLAPWFAMNDPGYDRFRANRALPPEALQALEAVCQAARG
jgi:hypothetical protein